MDRLDAMAMAAAAVDEGSLAAAARRFGRSAAAATRAIALLEATAGEPLLLRSTRGLRLTDAGERHLAVWREVLARLDELRPERSANIVGGTLVLTAPELFGRLKVVPLLELFLEKHPQVQVRALLLNRVVDMLGEGVDIAIRLAHLEDSSLMAIKLGEVRQLVCASPDYLRRRGTPQKPADLSDHLCIGISAAGNRELWTFRSDGSRTRATPVQTALSINSAGAGVDAALRGKGLVRALSYQVAEQMAAGRLQRVLPGFEPRAIPVNMVFRPDSQRQTLMRSFIDHAVPALRRELARIATIAREDQVS
jgi:DNA-binding transcriptional LysR family regulator